MKLQPGLIGQVFVFRDGFKPYKQVNQPISIIISLLYTIRTNHFCIPFLLGFSLLCQLQILRLQFVFTVTPARMNCCCQFAVVISNASRLRQSLSSSVSYTPPDSRLLITGVESSKRTYEIAAIVVRIFPQLVRLHELVDLHIGQNIGYLTIIFLWLR